jgi:dihydroxy-acid dehydratase
VLRGNLFDSAIMKTSVISDEFRQRYLSDPKDPNAFEGRAWCSTARKIITAHRRSRAGIDEHTILFMRGAGPIGYPGSAEVVNMQPPAALIKRGVTSLPCIGDGRQSGTSGSPSILNASPEAAAGGGLALLKTGDRVRIDLNKGTADMLISAGGIGGASRGAEAERRLPLSAEPDAVAGNPARHGRPARDGMVLEPAVKYQRVAQKFVPRDSH